MMVMIIIRATIILICPQARPLRDRRVGALLHALEHPDDLLQVHRALPREPGGRDFTNRLNIDSTL